MAKYQLRGRSVLRAVNGQIPISLLQNIFACVWFISFLSLLCHGYVDNQLLFLTKLDKRLLSILLQLLQYIHRALHRVKSLKCL